MWKVREAGTGLTTSSDKTCHNSWPCELAPKPEAARQGLEQAANHARVNITGHTQAQGTPRPPHRQRRSENKWAPKEHKQNALPNCCPPAALPVLHPGPLKYTPKLMSLWPAKHGPPAPAPAAPWLRYATAAYTQGLLMLHKGPLISYPPALPV